MPKKPPLYPHVPKSTVLPQTSPDGNNQKGISLNLTREQVTETIISNLVQAGILLTSETGHYRGVLETYDDITLLKVLFKSQELRGQ
jgi:hypothetical protein